MQDQSSMGVSLMLQNQHQTKQNQMDAMEGECETKWPTWMKDELKGTQMDVKQNGGQAHEPTTQIPTH